MKPSDCDLQELLGRWPKILPAGQQAILTLAGQLSARASGLEELVKADAVRRLIRVLPRFSGE